MTKIDSVDGDVLTYTDTTVTAGEVYRYKIRSNDLGSRSGRTEIAIPEATAVEPESEPVIEESHGSQPRVVPRNEVALVSNFGQSGSTTISASIQAQTFTTGSNTDGYGLNTVELRFQSTSSSTTWAVKIFTTNSDGSPNAEHVTLTNPAVADGTRAFTAPNDTTLDASTTYAVVITSAIGGSLHGNVERISSSGEDSGGADGWTIADNRYWKATATANWTSDSANLIKVRIKGTILPLDNTAPTLQTATVNGASLVLTYDEAPDSGSTPLASAYSVTVAGTSAAPSSISISGMTVTLTLAAAVTSGQTVTVTYTVPTGTGATPVQDEAGNAAAALTSQAVTNNTSNRAPTFDAGLPTSVGVAENTHQARTSVAPSPPPTWIPATR